MNNRMAHWLDLRCLVLRNVLRLVVGFTLLACVSHGQSTQSQANQLADSIAKVKSGKFINIDLEIVARAGAAQAVLPELEQQFAATPDIARKSKFASALVRLGDRDNIYWNFLIVQATLAIDSDLPDPFHDSQGNVMEHQLSPQLYAWAQAHKVDFSAAAQSALYDLPGKVLLLGATGDPRGIPVLRRALQSHNANIVIEAAKSLAQLQDNDSIPLIIDACRRAGKGMDGSVAAASLIFFDDPRAQSVVDTYVPKDLAKNLRDARAHGLKPFGY